MSAVERDSKGINTPSNGSALPQLPPELIEAIIRNNENDRSLQDILTASLVCKAWRSLSLPILFKVAKFSKERHFEQCRNTCDTLPQVVNYVREARFDPGSGNMGDVFRDLTARLSNMQELNTMNGNERIELMFSMLRTEAVSKHILPPDTPLPIFHRVTTFKWDTRIVGPPETRRPPKDFTQATLRFLSLFPNVETLHVEGSFGNQKDIYTLLRSFPKTRSLTFSDPIFFHSVRDLGATPLLPDLEKLYFDDCDRCGMLDWFAEDVLEHSKPLGLREIKFNSMSVPFSLEALTRLLEIAAPEHLVIPPLNGIGDDPENSLFALHPTAGSRLRSIVYDAIHLGHHFSPVPSLQRIASTLDSLSGSPTLHSVSLRLYGSGGPGDLYSLFEQSFDWESFERTLRRLPSLEKTVMDVLMDTGRDFNELDKSEIEKLIRAKLPGLGDRLVVRWTDENPNRTQELVGRESGDDIVGGEDNEDYEDSEYYEDSEGYEDSEDGQDIE